jgi:hypothetical protein
VSRGGVRLCESSCAIYSRRVCARALGFGSPLRPVYLASRAGCGCCMGPGHRTVQRIFVPLILCGYYILAASSDVYRDDDGTVVSRKESIRSSTPSDNQGRHGHATRLGRFRPSVCRCRSLGSIDGAAIHASLS